MASASNMTSKLYAWRPLAAKRLQISKIGRRILVALIKFNRGSYAVISGSNHASKIFAFEKRPKSPDVVREYAGTKLTSALSAIDGVVIATSTQLKF